MHGLRVIIGEPDDLQRAELKKLLHVLGQVIVGEAEDGLGTLKMVRRLNPDLVFLSLQPSMKDGEHVAHIIEDERLCPVVLLVERGLRESIRSRQADTLLPYLIKPVQEMSLLPIIDLAVSRFREVSRLEKEIRQLKNTIETRKIVEKAKGLLMRNLGINESEAFRRIQKQSMNKRLSLKAVAEAIIVAYDMQ
ncbi:ANTAR domain-containing protein [Heliobacterium gestii]|uniref:Stage 0 sporulation protein A homolog n=1 Tax=Heliomicrobium gestii TaxID=2699 RepID=A0A845LGC8_HELGE|nr:ANTAR domain-containing protein [Heliomicrobium gestii]MBM7867373.1 response regulator NasT [Heliomicrobium gestii]MZP43639.1 ANTAR domain-containing protein [Heliomicrobium gestii]